MEQISENVDLSRQTLNVDINSPIFRNMLDILDMHIKRVIKKSYDGEFAGGDINLKLSLGVVRKYKLYPAEKDGQPVTKEYAYKALDFKNAITTTLKKVDKDEIAYNGNKEIKEDDDGEFIEVPIKDPQISMFDEEA